MLIVSSIRVNNLSPGYYSISKLRILIVIILSELKSHQPFSSFILPLFCCHLQAHRYFFLKYSTMKNCYALYNFSENSFTFDNIFIIRRLIKNPIYSKLLINLIIFLMRRIFQSFIISSCAYCQETLEETPKVVLI